MKHSIQAAAKNRREKLKIVAYYFFEASFELHKIEN
jgi:hypothetical protein